MIYFRKLLDWLGKIVESIWLLSFSMWGSIWKRPFSTWFSPGNQRVLVVAPHPDDEVFGCGGTILLHKMLGDDVCVVYVTDGVYDFKLGLNPVKMAYYRHQEAIIAAKLLKIKHEWFGLPAEKWSMTQLKFRLQDLLSKYRPDIIYGPSLVDYHFEHHQVAHTLAVCLAQEPAAFFNGSIRIYQIHVPLTPVLTNLVADISSVVGRVKTIVNVYYSQFFCIPQTLRARRYAARFYGTKKQAEVFWQMSVDKYVKIHSTDPAIWYPFKQFSLRSFLDMNAYLRGLRKRQHFLLLNHIKVK